MTRLAIAFVLGALIGCSGSSKQTTTGGSTGGTPIIAKRVSLSWGVTPQGEMADLFLHATDETGHQVSHELGRWKGTCTPITPAPEMNALTGLACRTGGTGTELHAVQQGGDEIIVLKMGIDEGVKPDPMAREEVKRIKVPLGVKIEAGS
ncbi:MAG: hypothetical protein H0T46_28095 [Deltaproteobacteria bacterium]|nr:hypothetical protein [Deltaproteobacteria bacterium]